MPVMIPSGLVQLGQTPSSLSTTKPLNQFPPQFTSRQTSSSIMNGQDYTNIRPSVSFSIPPSSRSVHKQPAPPIVNQGSDGCGIVPALSPQPSGNIAQTNVSTSFNAEIQLTTRDNSQSESFSGAKTSLIPGYTSGTLSNSAVTFTSSPQDQFQAQPSAQQVQGSATFSSRSQKLPSGPGFPPGLLGPPLVSQQVQQPLAFQEKKTTQAAGFPLSVSGQQTELSSTTNIQPRMPLLSNMSSYPQQPESNTSTLYGSVSQPPAAHRSFSSPFSAPGGYPSPPIAPGGYPSPPGAQGSYSPPPAAQGSFSPPSGAQGSFSPPHGAQGSYSPPPSAQRSYSTLPGAQGSYSLPPGTQGSYSPPPGAQGSYSPPHGAQGSFPPLPDVPRGYPSPPGVTCHVPFTGSIGQMPPQTLNGAASVPPVPNITESRPGVATLQYKSQTPTGSSSVIPGHYPVSQYGPEHPVLGYSHNTTNAATPNFDQMGIHDSRRVVNLLSERCLIPPDGIETAKPSLSQNFKNIVCSPDILRCTLNAVPQNSALLNKARLPLGILMHPFKDLSQLPVMQSSIIVRCRSCKSYINPFVTFIDQRKWKCNMCYRANDVPDEFCFDPVSKTYGDPQRRPELKSATIEYIAPSDYMLRPPQPAVYLFLLDVSFNAIETGYLSQFSQVLLDEIDELPGDGRTAIGFLCYDSKLYYFNLAEGLSQPQMLCVPDLEDPFLPSPDNLLVNLHESKELVTDLLSKLPKLFEGNSDIGSALGAALQSAHKLMSPTGGRITVMQTCLPAVGPGALQNRDDGTTSGKNVTNIGPATDFYKKLSLDFSAQQIAVDLFMLNGQYSDLATLSCISKYSAGCIYYYPSFHTVKNAGLVDKFNTDLRRYLTRKIGFESVMRIRCTRGLSIHTFHGNFFVRSTDLLSLPNINPDAGFGMQMSIDDKLVESSTVSFQAALLYTSSKGERRIRVHTLCLPVTDQLSEVFTSADQLAIVALLAKMAVDRSLNLSISDARESVINASLDALMSYAQQIPVSQRQGTLLVPYSLRLIPMLTLALLKCLAFNLTGNTKVDDRVFAMQQCKVLPVCFLIQKFLPHLYPLHKLRDDKLVQCGKEEIPSAPLLPLSSVSIDRSGLFLLDTGEAMYILVGSEIKNQICQDIFGKPDFLSIPEDMMNLPVLENSTSQKVCSFVSHLRDSRPHGTTLLIIREDSKHRCLFSQDLVEDKSENSMSYFEFLQFLQGKAKN